MGTWSTQVEHLEEIENRRQGQEVYPYKKICLEDSILDKLEEHLE